MANTKKAAPRAAPQAPAQAVRLNFEMHTRLAVYVATTRGEDGKKLRMMDIVHSALDEYLRKRGA